MASLEQWAVIVAGGVALAIEANRQFARPAEDISHHRYPILRGVEPSSLCTPAEHRRGWFFYVCCYLGIYALFLISDNLRGLLADTASGQKVAGATGWTGSGDPSQALLDSTNLAMPIYLSAGLIALLSTGVAAQAEQFVRGVAYRLAGIPRGVYRLITRLSRLDYDRIVTGHDPALVQTFDRRIAGYPADLPLLAELVDETRQALTAVTLLAPAVTGDYANRFWPRENVHKLDELIARQRAEVEKLHEKAETLAPTAEAIEAFHLEALDTRNNLQALFAILYIRNQNAYLPDDHKPTARIIAELRRGALTAPMLHRVSNALLFTFLIFLVGYFLIDVFHQYYRGRLALFVPDTDVVMTWRQFWQVLEPLPATLAERPPGFAQVMAREARFAATEALLGTVSFLVLFGCAATIATVVRETRLDIGRWPSWRFRQLPMLRFVLAAIWPVLWAGLALILWKFASDMGLSAWYSMSLPTEQQAAAVLRVMFPFHMFPFGFAFIITLYVFIVADKHDDLSAWRTLLIAVLAALVYTVLAGFAVVSTYGFYDIQPIEGEVAQRREEMAQYVYAFKEIALHSLAAWIFFLLFAVFVEMSEIADPAADPAPPLREPIL